MREIVHTLIAWCFDGCACETKSALSILQPGDAMRLRKRYAAGLALTCQTSCKARDDLSVEQQHVSAEPDIGWRNIDRTEGSLVVTYDTI